MFSFLCEHFFSSSPLLPSPPPSLKSSSLCLFPFSILLYFSPSSQNILFPRLAFQLPSPLPISPADIFWPPSLTFPLADPKTKLLSPASLSHPLSGQGIHPLQIPCLVIHSFTPEGVILFLPLSLRPRLSRIHFTYSLPSSLLFFLETSAPLRHLPFISRFPFVCVFPEDFRLLVFCRTLLSLLSLSFVLLPPVIYLPRLPLTCRKSSSSPSHVTPLQFFTLCPPHS